MLTDQELRERWAASLRAARENAGLMQSELAREAHLTQQVVSKVENAGGLPNEQTKQALARALGKRVEDLFSYPDTATAAAS